MLHPALHRFFIALTSSFWAALINGERVVAHPQIIKTIVNTHIEQMAAGRFDFMF
jgi:hypothetical protein